VTFGIEHYEGFSAAPTVVHDVSDQASGRFWLRPFFGWRGFPLPDLEIFGGESGSAVDALRRPLTRFWTPTLNGFDNDVTSARYFPLTVTFEPNGCSGIVWPATCCTVHLLGVSIPLVRSLMMRNDAGPSSTHRYAKDAGN
jgi:hypothetical protein